MPKVQDPKKFPYVCVGLLAVTLEDGSGGWGTGSLIGETLVLTCGHNILYNKKRAASAVFYPSYSSKLQPTGGGIQVDCGFIKQAFVKGDRSWDIGVYRLQTPFYQQKYLQPTIVEDNKEPSNEMIVAGYPSNHHFEMWEEQELVSGFNVQENVFAYVHPTETGSSGSPLFQKGSGNAFVYGVHSGLAQNLDDKVGVLITQVTYGFIAATVQWGPSDYFVVSID